MLLDASSIATFPHPIMKTKNTTLALLVAAGLLSSTVNASAEIMHLDMNFPNIYSAGEYVSNNGDAHASNYEIRFNFLGSYTNLFDGFKIESSYYEETMRSGYHTIQVTNRIFAYSGAEILGIVNSGDIIGPSLTPNFETQSVSGYTYMLNPTEDINYYGLGAGNQIVALKSVWGYYGYVSLNVPNIAGKMYINDVVFNDVSSQGIVAGQASAAPDTPPVPEPSTYGLVGIGALGVAFAARRRKLKSA